MPARTPHWLVRPARFPCESGVPDIGPLALGVFLKHLRP
jgi:hypothetical protein